MQANYFANPLPVEVLPTVPVYGALLTTGICICEVADYPLKALVFISKNLKALADVVAEICSTLHNHDAAFNLLISDCGAKVFLFPQVNMVSESVIYYSPSTSLEFCALLHYCR